MKWSLWALVFVVVGTILVSLRVGLAADPAAPDSPGDMDPPPTGLLTQLLEEVLPAATGSAHGLPQAQGGSVSRSVSDGPGLAAADLATVRDQVGHLIRSYHNAVDATQRTAVVPQIDRLARWCLQLAGQRSGTAQTQLEACGLAVRLVHTLLQGADDQAVLERLEQLERLSQAAGQIDSDAAGALRDFLLLQVDLIAANRSGVHWGERPRRAIRRLERFVGQSPPSRHGHLDRSAGVGGAVSATVRGGLVAVSMMDAVRLALAQLYDQQGGGDRLCRLVEQMRSTLHRDNRSGRAVIDRWFGHCGVVGQRFEAQLVTDDGGVWSSKGHRGGAVLIHFWARWAGVSVEMANQLNQRYAELRRRGLSVLSVNLGLPTQGPPPFDAAWPTACSKQGGNPDLSGLFGVRSLPRFVLIDEQGRVVAVGSNLGVLEQIEGLTGPDPSDRSQQPDHTPGGVVALQEPVPRRAGSAETAIRPQGH